jgi:hypothetical protein
LAADGYGQRQPVATCRQTVEEPFLSLTPILVLQVPINFEIGNCLSDN